MASALPDVQAVVFHCRSLHGEASHVHAPTALRPDVIDLVARLRLSHVRLAALVTADDAAQLLAACARAAPLVHALGGGDGDHPPVDEVLASRDAVGAELLAAARRWNLAPDAVAVVGGEAAADVLAIAAAAGLRCVLLSGGSAPPAGALRHACRASDVPRALASPGDALVGLALSAKRDAALLRDGLTHALPRRGVALLRVDLAAPLPAQGPWHALLHKATDQVAPGAAPDAPLFAAEVTALAAYAQAHPATKLIEPLEALSVVFDRGAAAALLNAMPERLRSGNGGAHAPLAAPRSVALDTWDPAEVAAALEETGIELPCLVKPRVACGVPGAHAMALLLRASGGAGSRVALPAIAQAFVPHRGTFHKCYAVGDAVFASSRRSLPAPPEEPEDADAPGALPFDALAALPSHWASPQEEHGAGGARPASAPVPAAEPLDSAAVAAVAAWLREATGLRLLGFDVVVDAQTGAHTLVDLNYFPSCAQTPGAPEALAAMLRQAAGMPPMPSPHA